ncbi:MAG: hypothetical protein R3A44_28585 [Caldilineaceae bacterium]
MPFDDMKQAAPPYLLLGLNHFLIGAGDVRGVKLGDLGGVAAGASTMICTSVTIILIAGMLRFTGLAGQIVVAQLIRIGNACFAGDLFQDN